jgi:hypothetical protein
MPDRGRTDEWVNGVGDRTVSSEISPSLIVHISSASVERLISASEGFVGIPLRVLLEWRLEIISILIGQFLLPTR